ncbi:MAG: tetratricopeptide repeat protein [Erythrobacter sp.]|jgi:tetratricopeptide (TPR) repeat protein|nr:tetratricopeptide repeat protein [Erythrobacter sp.]
MPKRPLIAALAAAALTGCGAAPAQTLEGSAPVEEREEVTRALRQAREAALGGDFAVAQRLLDEARALAPKSPAVWVDIARLRFRRGDHAGALEAAQEALGHGPRFAPALVLRGQMARDAFGLGAALVWFEAALEADPDNTLALTEYAATLGDAGYHGQMLAAVRRLTKVEEKSPDAMYLQAVLAARAQMPVLAKNLLERSGKAENEVPAALMLDALVDLLENNHDSAAETLERLARRQPGNVRVSELLAKAMWLGGRDEELVARFAQAARHEAASPYLAMLVGRAHERLGNRAAAAPFLERAYAGRPMGWTALDAQSRDDLPPQTTRMRELVSAGQVGAAASYGASLRRDLPRSADIAALAGDAAFAARNPRGALELYRDAALIRRSWPLTRKAAAAYRDLGDPLAADVLVARHLRGEPRNTEALLLYAERSARVKDWLRVAVLLDNAIELGAGNDPRLLKLRGIAARALGDEAGAQRFERMTWELHPGIVPGV